MTLSLSLQKQMQPEHSLEAQALSLLAAGNTSAAVEAITASTVDRGDALEALAQLCKRAYRDLKNVPAMIVIAREAVGFGLICAEAAAGSELEIRYKTRVRAIAYNAGANCWPGWGDPVEIDAADIAEGLKFAERNQQLVEELGLGGKESGGAHWLVGALLMAAGQPSSAAAEFQRAEKAFHAAQLPVYTAMAQGYAALASKASPESRFRGGEMLEAILQTLRAMESKEAQFFADQLVTADRIFSSR